MTRMSRKTRMTRITRMTRMIWMTRKTRITRMTWMTRVTGMTRMTGKTRMTGMARITIEWLGWLGWLYNAIIIASNFHHLVWIVSCTNPHSDDLELQLCQHLISRLVSFSSESPLTSVTTVSTLAEFGRTPRPRNALDAASRATWDDAGGSLLRGMYFTKFIR